MSIIIIIASFLLDYLVSRFINSNMLYPLFTILSIILNKNNSYILCFLVGLIYDIIFTDTLFLNAVVFIIIMFIIKKLYRLFKDTYLTRILIGIISILLYRIMTYIILIITMYSSFDVYFLLQGLYSSILINLIYLFIFSYLVGIIKKEKR